MRFQKRNLKNGMTVLFEERDLPVVSLSITNRFGAAFESSPIKGISHFIEHLLFTGTKTRTHEEISREIEKRGGILNAFTDNDVTSFWFKLPSKHLFTGLEILTDMLNNPLFNIEKFEKEKRVIIEEIKMYHDDPSSDIYNKITENLYEKPFGEPIIGSSKTINALTRDFVFNYFQENYSPENFIVTIVGKADFEKVCAYLEKSFSPKSKTSLLPKILKKNTETIEEREGIDQSHIVFGIHAPMATSSDFNALEILDAYLARGMSSKLFLKIREEKGLAYAIRSSFETEKNYSYYTIYVGTTKEAIPEVKKLIIDGFKEAEKITPDEFKKAKEQLIGLKSVFSEESMNVMNELMYFELIKKAEDYYSYEKKIESITLEQVRNVAKLSKYSTAVIIPK